MLSKLDIGKTITIKQLPSYQEFFTALNTGVVFDAPDSIGGFANDILYTNLLPEDPATQTPLIPLVFPEVETFPETGLFLNHTGERVFYADTDGFLQEFLPETRTTTTPLDYGAIQIIARDIPLMLLEDGSMLASSALSTASFRVITATTRGGLLPLTIDGVAVTTISSFNYIGDKAGFVGWITPSRVGVLGTVELDGLIPTNIITSRDVALDVPPDLLQGITVLKDSLAVLSTGISNRMARFFLYNNTADSTDLLSITETNTAILPYPQRGIFLTRAITFELEGLLRSIYVSPERKDFLPGEEEGVYIPIWTPGYKVITITTQDTSQNALSILTNVAGVITFNIADEFYTIQDVEEVDSRESLITLIHRQTV